MEIDSVTNESATTVAKARLRRNNMNKFVHQSDRDRNQENIDDNLNVPKTSVETKLEDEDPRDSTKVEEKQASRSSTPNALNSSTPRRRKDPLANLHSNLSPKYIGFVTPTTNLDGSGDEGGRKTRRRHNINNNSIDTSLTNNNLDACEDITAQLLGSHDTSLGYVRRIPKDGNDSPEVKNGKKKEFVSPIDKLLKKNGSVVDKEILPNEERNIERDNISGEGKEQVPEENVEKIEADKPNLTEETSKYEEEMSDTAHTTGTSCNTEEVSTKNTENPSLECNQLVNETNPHEFDKKEISELADLDTNNEDLRPDNGVNVAEVQSLGNFLEENIRICNDSDHKVESDNKVDVNGSDREVEPKTREHVTDSSEIYTKEVNENGKSPDIDMNSKNLKEVHGIFIKSEEPSTVNDEEGFETEEAAQIIEKNPETIEHMETLETESNTGFVVDATAAKSPSAVSMDSAKGSSIINEVSWMSFVVGDLFWGQIYNYCYWPCMVCPDPDGKSISTKESNTSGDQHIMVHVRFFADNARRNWVRRENLMPFTTLQQYQDRLEECREKYGAKSAKFRMFVPKKKQESVWYEAVKEANMVADVPYEERLEKFYEIFDKSKTTQKMKQQRRKSMYVPGARQISASDGESLYGSHENVNNLTVPIKRERSTSPFSPAYSPIKNMTFKKRKLSRDVAVNNSETIVVSHENISRCEENTSNDMESSNSSHLVKARKSLQDMEIFNGLEFQKFYFAMRDYVLEDNTNEELDKSLVVAVRNIWALKQLSRQQMLTKLNISNVSETSQIYTGTNENVKRLSNRLKSIMIRKSLQSQRSSFDLTSDVPDTSKQVKESLNSVEKPKKVVNRPIMEVIDDIFELDNKYLFKGMGRDPVCKYCYKPGGNLRRCSKNCHSWMHVDCINKTFTPNGKLKKSYKKPLAVLNPVNDSTTENSSTTSSTQDLLTTDTSDVPPTAAPHITSESEIEVVCRECANNEPMKCMVCNLTDSGKLDDPLVKCSMSQCERAFHPSCCKYWPQSKITISKNHIESFRCPSHVCHTCVSDDPKGKFQQLKNARLTKCVKCPASFHTDSTCIPAGSQILTAAHIICPRHASLKHDMLINVNWCFFCVRGGQVVCCETCPTAVHAQCLKIPIDPNEGYICEECESGRMPLYGEMVWAKFTNFRWWPAIILPPTEIPKNIAKRAHNPSDFVVRFFGTHDHGWISRRRVYLYLEGDSSEPPKSKTSSLDISYNRGVEEAKQVYEIIKAKKLQQRNLNENKEKLHPQPYVRIKANRAVPPVKLHVDIDSVSKCDCDPNDDNPCGPDTNCLNRVLYHECNPKVCPARERCQNQMFESRISPRLDVVYMKERGFGLICLEPIKAGSFVIEYVGEIINDDEFRARMAQKSLDRDENFYFLSVEKDYIIDAGPKGNLARFMNHSCDPNCETQKWSVNSLNRVGLFAIKDIPENTELTFNYHWDDLLGNEKKTCYCGSKNCSGEIGGKLKEAESKESTPGAEDLPSKTTKGRPKKSKLKTLKRLPSKAAIGKRKTTAKVKANGAKRKPNKKIATNAAVPPNNVPQMSDSNKDESDVETITTNTSPTPENAIC
ncbi:nuclear receptor binding SET domain protein [Haematobia irritans]|uniref:nuclear receptor binding SET domain protein n=1 Tax=Haematobia irritans TaxID=7368 RepID=UPI003F5058BD